MVPEEAEAPAAVFVDGPGEARLKGPLLFREYFGRPEATQAAFDEEGYFRTGDTVQRVRARSTALGAVRRMRRAHSFGPQHPQPGTHGSDIVGTRDLRCRLQMSLSPTIKAAPFLRVALDDMYGCKHGG